MVTETTNLLGFDIEVQVPETLAELIELAGSEERVRDLAIKNVLAHSHYTKVRRAIIAHLEKAFTNGDQKCTQGEDEREAAFVTRLENEFGKEALVAVNAEILALSQNMPVDFKAAIRGVGEAKVPAKRWIVGVQELKDAGKYERFLEKYNVTITGNETETEELHIVANKLREVVLEQERVAKQAIFGEI